MNEAPELGPAEGFEALVRDEYHRLVVFAMRLGAPLDQATDIVQDTLMDVWQQWASIKSPEAFARTVLRRRLIDLWRRRTALVEPIGDLTALERHEEPTEQPDFGEQTVLEHIKQLPRQQRLVFTLHVEGFRNAEIAEILSITSTTVASHLRHARSALRDSLSAEGVLPGRSRPDTGTV